MNVLTDPWIPIIRADGTKEKVKPSQITSNPQNPIINLNCGRPDFNAFAVRFLVGLYNTYLAPNTKKQWKEQFKKPPKQTEILNKLKPKHFKLDGKGYRFLQDTKPDELEKVMNIGCLLIETPGEKTIKDGKDFFQKKMDHIFCQTCATIALYLRQCSAIMCGVGYRTSITSGANGSLTTFITMDTLWKTIWSNVIVKRSMNALGGNPKGVMLPWLINTVDSKDKSVVPLDDKHPYYPLWEMPLRIHLMFEKSHEACSICGEHNSIMILKYRTKNYGNSYTNLRHIFSPFFPSSKDREISFKKPESYTGYTDLVTFLIPTKKTHPAHAVDHFITNRTYLDIDIFDLWTFGYHTNKAKFYGWEEYNFPLSILLFKDVKFTIKISQLSYLMGWYINNYIKKMWGIEKSEPLILSELFKNTEENFYTVLINRDTEDWVKSMVIKAIALLEKHVGENRKGLQRYFIEQYIEIINNKIVKPLKIKPLDYSDFIHLEYQKLNLPYLEEKFLTPFLSWYGTIKSSQKIELFTDTPSVHTLTEKSIFINLINYMEEFYPDLKNNSTKDLFAAALLIAFKAQNLNFSLSFPAQMATNDISPAQIDLIMGYEKEDIIADWEPFADIIAQLKGFNIASFLNGFMHWDKEIKDYWKKEYYKYL